MHIKNLGKKQQKTNQYIKVEVYIPGLTRIMKFFKEVYIIKLLKAGLIFNIDIIKPKGIITDLD